ncbi:MAG: thermonuclease family protein [Pirellulales bacterium]|nr:thermonuclease family protein [Pirellulales bacterium]
MKRQLLPAIVVVIGMAWSCSAADTLSGKVTEVKSGDTLVVVIDGSEKTIALAGLAAPSQNHELAEKAKKELAARVADRDVTVQMLGRDKDRGDTAAVWHEKRSINAEMLREGWAWFDPRHPEYKALASAEKEARTARRGLWAKDDPGEQPPWLGKKSSADAASSPSGVPPKQRELATDDGKPAGKKSFPRGYAVKFKVPEGKWALTAVRIHGSRYGHPTPPREDFHVTLCKDDFTPVQDFPFPYSRFRNRGNPKWVTLKVKPTEVSGEFVLCVDFNAQPTKGVYVTHDAEGTALIGKPGRLAGTFSGGDWFIRAVIEPRE